MKYIITLIVLILVGLGVYVLIPSGSETTTNQNSNTDSSEQLDEQNADSSQEGDDQSNNGQSGAPTQEVIGASVEGRDITAHHFGSGDTEILFVGGIHGGYSPNTTLLMRRLVDHFNENPDAVPANVAVTVIPTLNPDGLYETMGTTGEFNSSDIPSQSERTSGRFNANSVDLNRNFACNWKSSATWRNQTVDAGDEAFSEPEARALRDYVNSARPTAVVIYHSAAGGVYASSCNSESMGATDELMDSYADASGYSAEGTFDAYQITGDAADWLAREEVPAISVLLETHNQVEWAKNKSGVEAVLDRYAE